MKRNLFRTTPLAPYFEAASLCLWDIGARGGIDGDFAPFAWAVDAVGFEPDQNAFGELATSGLWRSERFFQTAIGGSDGSATLNIPTDPAGASVLEHDAQIGARYHLDALFDIRTRATVDLVTMKSAIRKFGAPPPSLLKLDVEGLELEILRAGRPALDGVVAIKAEAAFLHQRIDQPLAADLMEFLGECGFCLADITAPVRWRVRPWAPDPFLVKGTPAYSRGRLAQADLVFLREPTTAPPGRTVPAVMAAVGLGYFDHGHELFEANSKAFADELVGHPDLAGSAGVFGAALATASQAYGRARVRDEIRAGLTHLFRLARSVGGGLNVPT